MLKLLLYYIKITLTNESKLAVIELHFCLLLFSAKLRTVFSTKKKVIIVVVVMMMIIIIGVIVGNLITNSLGSNESGRHIFLILTKVY